MNLDVKHLVIHKLEKEKGMPGKQVIANDITELNEDWSLLVESVLNSIGKTTNIRHGVFHADDNKGQFPDYLDQFLLSDPDMQGNEFYELTTKAMTQLTTLANSQAFATGGYVLFIHYLLNNHSFMLVVMIKDKEGPKLNYNETTQQYELEKGYVVDTEKLHQAFRLDINKYNNSLIPEKADIVEDKENDERIITYLSFISLQKQGSKDPAKYFIDTFRCTVAETSERSTRIVIKKTHDFFKSHDNPELKKKAKEVKDDVLNYLKLCMDKGQDANLTDIMQITVKHMAGIIDEDQQGKYRDTLYEDIVHSSDSPVSHEFKVGMRAYRSYAKIKLDNPYHDIRFDIQLLSKASATDPVYFDAKTGKIIITPDSKMMQELSGDTEVK